MYNLTWNRKFPPITLKIILDFTNAICYTEKNISMKSILDSRSDVQKKWRRKGY